MIFRFGASGLSVPSTSFGVFKRWATNLGGGNTQNGRDSAGRRLGVKLGNGATAHKNQIIIRQRGFQYWPGSNDHTLHAKVDGIVKFSKDYDTKRTYVNIIPSVWDPLPNPRRNGFRLQNVAQYIQTSVQ